MSGVSYGAMTSTTKINTKINNLKLLEQFYIVLGRGAYQDNDNAWKFREILNDIIYESNPTHERHAITNCLPQLDVHFNSEKLLDGIKSKIDAITELATVDKTFASQLAALLK
jgi:hypothetical protein